MAARCQFDSRGFETYNALRETGKRQTLAFFTISYELATGNWQPNASSILEDFLQF